MKTCLLVITILVSATVLAQNKDETAIRKLLSAQVSEWNKGNIEGYMKGYWESDSLIFIGKNGPTYGYVSTLKRYKKAYPDKDAMGKLESTVITVKRLSDNFYFIIGKWALERKAGNLSGSFTLLLQKINDKWVIINDHSS